MTYKSSVVHKCQSTSRQLQYPIFDDKIKSIDSDIYISIFNTAHNYSDTYQSPTWVLCQVWMVNNQYARS